MQVDSPVRTGARVRRLEVSPAWFRRLAIAAAGMLLVIVATGATVRLTASGLGCEHWPGCQPGDPFPKKGYHSYVEFSNRVVAFFTILVTLATALASVFARVIPRVKWLAWSTFVGTLAQAPLGAITVYYHLNPWLVISHLLLSLVVLGVGVLLVLEVFERPSPGTPPLVRWGSLVALAALCVLVVSGTIVTGSGPHPGGSDVRRLGAFADAIWLHVRATAVFGILFLAVLAWAARRRDWALRGALAVLALLLLQMAIGEIQYRNALPWWLVLVHVTMAAAVWAAAVAFVASIWRSRA
jgi:cytochrome c oxidase assembly protein subunit 15